MTDKDYQNTKAVWLEIVARARAQRREFTQGELEIFRSAGLPVKYVEGNTQRERMRNHFRGSGYKDDGYEDSDPYYYGKGGIR